MTIAAPAKINLWLRVGPRGHSGYHPLSTLFCTLDLADTVVIRRPEPGHAPTVKASFAPPLKTMPELGPPESNLAVRAARAFVERARLPETPDIQLVKRIPAAGGLGGGSSDAGAVLRALRRMHPRSLSGEDLLEIATKIGSDVPFFVLGAPLAHGVGRGERLTPLPPLPPRPTVLVLPPFAVNTGDAYRWLDEARGPDATGDANIPDSPDPAAFASELTWRDVADAAANDFEGPVFDRHPELREVRDALRAHGALPALLAGSGSTVFGIMPDPASAEAAARSVRAEYPMHHVLLTVTRTR